MAINYIEDDLTHICKTTSQWQTTTERYEIIPKGVLCIELCNDKLTKVKIGNGHLIYEQLPYVSAVDLNNYYTKEETDTIIKNIKRIEIKGEASSLSDLPLSGNTEGDLWFVKRQDPVTHNRYDEYIWYKDKWESWNSSDIDLSEYAKKSYVYELIQTIQKEIDDIIETVHTHSNKSILDQTSAIYDTTKDNKLSSLQNYDDTAITNRIYTLENISHTHDNMEILNRITAAFTREQAITLLDCVDFTGTDGTEDGYHGFVPAPSVNDADKVLGSNGQWVENRGTTYEAGDGITIDQDNVISTKLGAGLTIDEDDAVTLDPTTVQLEINCVVVE